MGNRNCAESATYLTDMNLFLATPRKITLDGNGASHLALRLVRHEDPRWRAVVVRRCRYLNNIVEQDHRAIKHRCVPMLGLKSFTTAAITLAGIELAHRIANGSFHLDVVTAPRLVAQAALGSSAGLKDDPQTSSLYCWSSRATVVAPEPIIQVADTRARTGGRDVVHGRAIKNNEALANPEARDLYKGLPQLQS